MQVVISYRCIVANGSSCCLFHTDRDCICRNMEGWITVISPQAKVTLPHNRSHFAPYKSHLILHTETNDVTANLNKKKNIHAKASGPLLSHKLRNMWLLVVAWWGLKNDQKARKTHVIFLSPLTNLNIWHMTVYVARHFQLLFYSAVVSHWAQIWNHLELSYLKSQLK